MSDAKKMSASFRITLPDLDQIPSNRPFIFPPIQTGDGKTIACKYHRNETFEIVILDESAQTASFLEKAPQGDKNKLHVVITWDEGKICLYLDGEFVSSRDGRDPFVVGSIKEEGDNVSDIFETALSFDVACQVLIDTFTNSPYAISNRPTLLVPACVCEAFAIELYIKCLYLIDHNERAQRIHSLVDLFNKLSTSTQGKVKTEYDKWLSKHNESNSVLQAQVGISIAFDDALRECDDGFQHWRYIHESIRGNAKVWHGFGIKESAKRAVLALRSDLTASLYG